QEVEGGRLGFRTGAFTRGGHSAPTPLFFPIVNIITGPPPVLANGGIWRHIKVALFQDRKIPAFMTHVLHFSDYSVDRRLLERWFRSSIPEQIESATQQHPLLFVDSGGYRLLYNSGLDIERYGLRATVQDILRLQARFGGDIVATLDFPIPPRLEEDEARTRINKSIENCVKTLQFSKRILDDRFMVHLAVHGRSRLEARNTVEKLFKRLRNERLNHVPIGVAIGSLVPLASSPLQVIEIVRGVTEGIHACPWLHPLQIPVH